MKKYNCSGACERNKEINTTMFGKVCSYCPNWLQECEARMLLTLPLEQRRNELKERELKRGKSAVDELREIILCLWQKKADQKSAKPTRKVQDN